MKKSPKIKEVVQDLKDFKYWLKEKLTWLKEKLTWLKENRRSISKRAVKYGLLALPVILVVVQLVYPAEKLPMFMTIDGLIVGGQDKQQVIKRLNDGYKEKQVKLYLGDVEKSFASPRLDDIGLEVSNTNRIMGIEYPWYLRLVPTSMFWVAFVTDVDMANYKNDETVTRQYVVKRFGEDCKIEPVNPSAEVKKDKISIISGSDGGTCQTEEVVLKLSGARPTLDRSADIKLKVEPIKPTIAKEDLEKLVEKVEENLAKGVSVMVADEKIELDKNMVRSWLEFHTDGDAIRVTLNTEKADPTLREKMADKLARPAGVTKITTRDFAEIGREEGARGQELDVLGTLGSVVAYLTGESENSQATVKDLPPRVEYVRTYSKSHAGLSALLKNYSEDKPGDYGISLIELSGQRRSAGYNEDRKFTTASTYKVYVAYSVLRRIDTGEFKWNNPIVSGRNLSRCFDDMIAQSDNPCAEELVRKIGYTPLHHDVTGLDLKGTSFIDRQSFKTTAGDLSKFLAMLETGQLPLSESSRDRLLNSLRRNVYRQGIPAGTDGEVANKVGFIEKLLHDTAIVYSPSGTYVLTILSDGSSWANIAELTRQIESLR